LVESLWKEVLEAKYDQNVGRGFLLNVQILAKMFPYGGMIL
jgi:hypothetical protein